MDNGIPVEFEMPGEAFDFEDVTSVFEQAAAELEDNEVILMEGVTLQDAMAALEIGEPQLDTGAIAPETPEGQPSFHPLRPLLPEEVCWILDQSMAYEMEFHAGSVLAHTVYTLLYVHHLDDINPETVMKCHSSFEYEHHRPLALITIVLRTAVQALLKCVDLSWRELARGGMHEAEDWQSDKCEISLLEGVPGPFIVQRLDSALRFVSESSNVPENSKPALISRLMLRQSLLVLLGTDIINHRNDFTQMLLRARQNLQAVKSNPIPTPAPVSAAVAAFDPYFCRKLQMTTPIRVVKPPSFEDTCGAVERFLDGLVAMTTLTSSSHLTTWQAMSDLCLWLPNSRVLMPYVRSLGQTTFYDGSVVLKRHTAGWVLNRFFFESCGKTYDFLRTTIYERWKGDDPFQASILENTVCRLVIPHIQALFNNPPRRRRYFMKNLIGWHRLYEILVEIKDNMYLDALPPCDILACLPDVALIWRLSIIREVVLSGFQLELYLGDEVPFAYWYSAKVTDEHLRSLDSISSTVLHGSEAHREMSFQFKFLTLMQSLCTSLFVASISMISFDAETPNFTRRYKWAFRPEYATSFELSPVAQPDIQRYLQECDEILRHVDGLESWGAPHERGGSNTEVVTNPSELVINFQYPADYVELAKSVGEEMLGENEQGAWAGAWAKGRVELIRHLCAVCTDLCSLPRTRHELNDFDARKRLKWDPVYSPWFPKLLP